MMKIVLALFALLCVAAEIYIYKRFFRARRRGAAWLWAAGAVYAVFGAVMVLMRYTPLRAHPATFIAGMWAVWAFFLLSAPKLTFAVFVCVDGALSGLLRRRARAFSWIGAAAAVVLAAMMIDGAWRGRRTLRVERVRLEYAGLPSAFAGLRVVQFSDLHLGTMAGREALLTRMVDSINSLRPDIVIQSGDIVNISSAELTPRVVEILSRIRARYGVYSVYGNHDLGFYLPTGADHAANILQVRRIQEDMGWTFLHNGSEYLRVGGDSIMIAGLNFPDELGHNGLNANTQGGGLDMDAAYGTAPAAVFDITVSHAPQLWPAILERGRGDLTLSGHVHAMQAKIVVGKWRWSPAQYMYEQWSGLYGRGEEYLYVNDGVGCVLYPMRVGAARPEVTLIELFRP